MKDVPRLGERIDAINGLPESDPQREAKALALFGETLAAPVRADSPWVEPSDLAGIRQARPKGARRIKISLSNEELADRIHGAWLGRIAGNLLGKPVETWRRARLSGFARAIGNFPIRAYLGSNQSAEICKQFEIAGWHKTSGPWVNNLAGAMPEDDDLNYTVIGLMIVESKGRAFTSRDLAELWLGSLPYGRVYADEAIAYRNLVLGFIPPTSATQGNPCREWIGAQIRADAFGYVNPGWMEKAAEMAWRDASMSHIKNGIYGEMWAAAMLAAAAATRDMEKVVQLGLSEIPARSRLAAEVNKVIGWRHEGIGAEQAIDRIHQAWDESKQDQWCYVIPNSMLVAVGLLWGEGDFAKTVGTAVGGALDTDCNGATAGSVAGMMLGAKALPKAWTQPLGDTLITGVAGQDKVAISDLARRTLVCARKSLEE